MSQVKTAQELKNQLLAKGVGSLRLCDVIEEDNNQVECWCCEKKGFTASVGDDGCLLSTQLDIESPEAFDVLNMFLKGQSVLTLPKELFNEGTKICTNYHYKA